jgi:hypothetical protein
LFFNSTSMISPLSSGRSWAMLLTLLIAPIAAWRGWAAVAYPVTFDSLRGRFQAGAFMVISVVAIAAWTELELPFGVPLLMSFFLLSFLALVLARTEQGNGARGAWIAVALTTVGLVFLAGMSIDLAAEPVTNVGVESVQWAWGHWVQFVMETLPGPPADERAAMPPPTPPAAPDIPEPRELSPAVLAILRYGMMALGIAFVGLIVAGVSMLVLRLVRRWLNQPSAEIERLSTSRAIDWRKWMLAVQRVFIRLRDLFQRRFARGRQAWTAQYHYAMLQKWGRRRGVPRLPDQTPFEYLAMLGSVWPDHRPAFEQITQAYVVAHYSPRQPDGACVQESAKHLKTLSTLRRRETRKLTGAISILWRGNR